MTYVAVAFSNLQTDYISREQSMVLTKKVPGKDIKTVYTKRQYVLQRPITTVNVRLLGNRRRDFTGNPLEMRI